MNINKLEFINQLTANYGYTSSSATMIVEDFWACVRDNLEAGNTVSFHGIGSFDLVRHAQKRCYNPTTGKSTIHPEHFALRFSPGKTLKRAVEHHGRRAKSTAA